MVRPPRAFRELARAFVCVRVTDMRTVDIDLFRFDYDLTLAMLVAHADGTVYHRFGARDERDPLVWASLDALMHTMRAALERHAEYSREPAPPVSEGRTPLDLEVLAEKLAGKPGECVHCHSVHDAERDAALAAGSLTRDDVWIYPSPVRVGLELDPVRQNRVVDVAKGSAAHAAGVRAGDELVQLGNQRLATIHDVTWVLHHAPASETTLPLVFIRSGEPIATTLTLTAGWKRGDARSFAWRPYKWGLRPNPGFGGRGLDAAERLAIGLPADRFAFRITYVIDWGPDAALGRHARAAGLTEGDVVLAIDGKTNFDSVDHVQAWVRLERNPGDVLELTLHRGGETRKVKLELLP